MDENNNGMVSFDELLNGYDQLPEFQHLMDVMDIKREDMETVFHVLDSDDSQEVSYLEFCQNLGAFFRRDPVIMQSLVKYSVLEVRKILEKDVLDILNEHTNMLRVLIRRRDLTGEASATGPSGQPSGQPSSSGQVSVPSGQVSVSGPSQFLSTLDQVEGEMAGLLAKAEDLAMTAMLSVHESYKPRKVSRVCQRGSPWQPVASPGANSLGAPSSPVLSPVSPSLSVGPVGPSPSAPSVVTDVTVESYGDFSIQISGSHSPSIGPSDPLRDQQQQHDHRLSEVSDAENVEVELLEGESESDPVDDVERHFAELSVRLKERMHDAERLQERCQKMVHFMEQSHIKTPASLARMKLHKV